MGKWFHEVEQNQPNIIYSRIRLARNWQDYPFSFCLSQKESKELIKRLEEGLDFFTMKKEEAYQLINLEAMSQLDRLALKERRILNSALVSKKQPTSMFLSKKEDASIVLNGDDHIRILRLKRGLQLKKLWEEANGMDDEINAQFPYAFDEKYGYLTSFPTNVGTGLKASVLLHLPTLSMSKKFSGLLGEMSRFGTTIRGIHGTGSENYGALYEVSNQKTLGCSEKEIIDLVSKVAVHLASQESQVRKNSLENHRLEREDETYKSYGVLRYAKRLSRKDAMMFLSQLMAGMEDGLIEMAYPYSIYGLMLGIEPANLQKASERPLSKEEIDIGRAQYIRKELPELKEMGGKNL